MFPNAVWPAANVAGDILTRQCQNQPAFGGC